MESSGNRLTALRAAWALSQAHATAGIDYTLLGQVGPAWAARSRAGHVTLILPVAQIAEGTLGRRASGCELLGHVALQFAYDGCTWTAPAAALVCTDPQLAEAFAVLAADIVDRSRHDEISWKSILALVEEWQSLLAARGQPTPEGEAGLWGELWFIDRSTDVERALLGWRGPERDATDFLVDGRSVDVKMSRVRRQHHVSLSEVSEPVGSGEGWLLSMWSKVDPAVEVTVPVLVERILARVADPADALRRFARAGYSPADQTSYMLGFVVLAEPEWYSVDDVPRVRVADPGVSQVRYRVVLDEDRRADAPRARSLWQHFHGHDYEGCER